MPQPWSPYTIPSISLKASPSNTAIPLNIAQRFIMSWQGRFYEGSRVRLLSGNVEIRSLRGPIVTRALVDSPLGGKSVHVSYYATKQGDQEADPYLPPEQHHHVTCNSRPGWQVFVFCICIDATFLSYPLRQM
jgi:hypothetical protein